MISLNWVLRSLIFLAILIISVIISSFYLNAKGDNNEKYLTELYQKIIRKKPQLIDYDTNGVPFVLFEGPLGKKYNAVTVAEEVLRIYEPYDSISFSRFKGSIDWLVRNAEYLNDSSLIYYDYYDWPKYNMTSPWRSAMNQGRAMQAFLRAFEVYQDSVYLEMAKKNMNSLFVEVRYGGVTYKDMSNYWYEEYADDSGSVSMVLNGMLVVLNALSDYNHQMNDTISRFLYLNGLNAVVENLERFDHNGWSNYDILGNPSTMWYHKFHIQLLKDIYKETGNKILKETIIKWENYTQPSYIERLILKPTNIKIFTVLLAFSTCVAVLSVLLILIIQLNKIFKRRS